MVYTQGGVGVLHTRVVSQGGVPHYASLPYPGDIPYYASLPYPGWYIPGYTPILLYRPGYTSYLACTSRVPVIAVLGVTLRREGALGSNLGLIRTTRRIEAPSLPKV